VDSGLGRSLVCDRRIGDLRPTVFLRRRPRSSESGSELAGRVRLAWAFIRRALQAAGDVLIG
jgi:hypothetical protein